MKKIACILSLVLLYAFRAQADHIKGGEISYTYLNESNGYANYVITVTMYIDCDATPRQLDGSVALTIFSNANNQQYGAVITANLSGEKRIFFDPASNPCISNAPSDVCYRVRSYVRQIALPITAQGYTIAYQRCCRITNIINLTAPSDKVGGTYTCQIPGTNISPDAYKNSSPAFLGNDATVICVNSSFSLDYSAIEREGDSVAYAFCSGLSVSDADPAPVPAARPPYNELSYSFPYSGTAPLGNKVSIDPKTGIITGVAPGVNGQYVISVCAKEYRNGILINTHRKDIHVAVSNCIPLSASLKPEYSFCDNFQVDFKNEINNPPGTQFVWDYGDNTKPDTTSDPQGRVTHQYLNPGNYVVKIKALIGNNGQCVDIDSTIARVWPGFLPGFTTAGSCFKNPFQFTDTSITRYGSVNKWSWDFGDETKTNDTSNVPNPGWTYSTSGFKTVKLKVETDRGCVKEYSKVVDVRDKPFIGLRFRDTLICSIDTLQLNASGSGIFAWSPAYNILGAGTATPSVYPKTTTTYKVMLDELGCINEDSVKVRVVDQVSLFAGNDTLICATDTVMLLPQSDGLQYSWTPVNTIINPTSKNPKVHPTLTTTYQVTARIGGCSTTDALTVYTVPYPVSFAGQDTAVCYADTASLRASVTGSRFTWAPVNTLSDATSLSPLAFPLQTTTYILKAYDTLGCPKPGISTVTVKVFPPVVANAGNDTAIVKGQPLQLNGSGATRYEWSPASFLNNPDLQNPIATLSDNFSYTLKASNAIGCFDYDTILIKVFQTAPDIFVPNAFVPKGVNRVLRPIPVGVTRIEYFRIYNRWGQLVFETSETGKGWDGTIGGQLQDTGTYVWVVQGVDYTGKRILRKGTAILIR